MTMEWYEWLYLLIISGLFVLTAWKNFQIGRETGRAERKEVAAPAVVSPPPSSHEAFVDVLVMVWKLRRKADASSQPVLRATERILARAEKDGFKLRTYAGTKLLPGTRVQVVDTIPGPAETVVEDLEPEVLRDGTLVRPAAVTVGNGS